MKKAPSLLVLEVRILLDHLGDVRKVRKRKKDVPGSVFPFHANLALGLKNVKGIVTCSCYFRFYYPY